MKTSKHCLLSTIGVIVGSVAVAVANAASPPAEVEIPGQRVFPESITSTSDGTLIIGSIGMKQIFRVKPGAATAGSVDTAGS